MFGPLAPVSFRLQGRDALADAAERFAGDAWAFGSITSNDFSERERRELGHWPRPAAMR